MANTYWQISAGAEGRNYTDYFIKYGMAFVGGDGQIATMREIENQIEQQCFCTYSINPLTGK
jgi:hypothetical protein